MTGSYVPFVAWVAGIGLLGGGLLVFTVLSWHVRKRLHSYLRAANGVRAITTRRRAGLTEGLSTLDYEELAKVFMKTAPLNHAWHSFSSKILRQQNASGEVRLWRQESAEDTLGIQLESEIMLYRSCFAAAPEAILLVGLFLTLTVFLASMFQPSTEAVSRTFGIDLLLRAFPGALMPLTSGLLVATIFLVARAPLIYRLNQARLDLVAAINSFVPCLSLAAILVDIRREASNQSVAAQSLSAELQKALRQSLNEGVNAILERVLAAIEELRSYEETVEIQHQRSMSEIVGNLHGLTAQLEASNSTLDALLNLAELLAAEQKRRLEEQTAGQSGKTTDENQPINIAGVVTPGDQPPQEARAHEIPSAKIKLETAKTEGSTEAIETKKGNSPDEATPRREEAAESLVGRPPESEPADAGGGQSSEERRRIAPDTRGGGRFDVGGISVTVATDKSDSLLTRPEIVCWNRERKWIPAVELPGGFLGDSDVQVEQNGSLLQPDETRNNCWPLLHVWGSVAIVRGEDRTTIKVEEGRPLLFKLSSHDESHGRLVRATSYGNYLVIVREDWERDASVSDQAAIEPEQVIIPGFRAYFFCLKKGSADRIAFLPPAGERIEINSRTPKFELVGNRLPDANEEIGPLFGETPPRINAANVGAWEAIKAVVVGDEGRGRHKWRKVFAPSPELLEQDLPPEISRKKGGWYFLRFYDYNENLMESLDFRFIRGLTQITVVKPNPFPSPTGHEAVTIEFFHTNECFVRAVKDGSTNLEVSRTLERTTVSIPPHPSHDQTYWEIQYDQGPSVGVTVLVERIWWSQGDEQAPPNQTEWRGTPLTVERGAFAATSNKIIYLWFPGLRWVDGVYVGFERNKRLRFEVSVTQRYASIPLRTFGDFAEIQDPSQCAHLKVWIERAGTPEEGITIGEIPSELAPAEPIAEGPPPITIADSAVPIHFCPTCDHARHKEWMYWCRRNHWYSVTEKTFYHTYAGNWCPEWQGEQQDADSNWEKG